MTAEDVERLVAAHEKVREALDQKAPRRAARVLCDELRWLIEDNGAFWADVRKATETLRQHRDRAKEVLNKITSLVESEEAIFARLGIDASRSGPILGSVYSRIDSMVKEPDPSPDSLGILRERLSKARDLVCQASKGPLRQARDWLVSWRGATVLAGTAVIGANVAIVAIPPHVHHISWASIKAGVKVAKGDVEGIIDILT